MSINLKTQIEPELLKVTELIEVKQYNFGRYWSELLYDLILFLYTYGRIKQSYTHYCNCICCK